MLKTEEELEDEEVESVKVWQCEECGYRDYKKPIPRNRERYYSKLDRSEKCPKCKSIALVPYGF